MAKPIGRFLSLAIAASVIGYVYFDWGEKSAFQCAMFYIFPLFLIWFPDEMGGYTGMTSSQYIDQSTPPGCVSVGGWFMLFLPFIMAVIIWMRS